MDDPGAATVLTPFEAAQHLGARQAVHRGEAVRLREFGETLLEPHAGGGGRGHAAIIADATDIDVSSLAARCTRATVTCDALTCGAGHLGCGRPGAVARAAVVRGAEQRLGPARQSRT